MNAMDNLISLHVENRKLKVNTDHLFKLVVAMLHNAGGQVAICERIMGEASLLENPEIVTQSNPDGSYFFITLKKALTK